MPTESENEVRTGVLAATAAYLMWGFFPLYFIVLRGVPSAELLVHRILFSVPLGLAIILMRGQWSEVRRGLSDIRILTALAVSSVFIAANWLVYIIAVQHQHIFQASLGYYINPLIYVLVGVVLLGERLRPGQITAVALATVGVLILTVYGGTFPVVSLTLAISFTIYGYVRKRASIGAMPGLFIETVLLAPIAAVALFFMVTRGDAAIETAGPGLVLLLAFAGPATVIPLLCFAIGARRLTLATLGFLQFIGPTIQFLIGLADGEPFTFAHKLCFGFIWSAAAIFAWDAWRTHARPMRPAPVGEVD
ncbi:EamA family transporter RarD [Parvularcula dongshanensis]|uniref:Chloramphenicol-sensitive protein RarD n=1 Tax=Parvularcula dongshanensis TaxID=1173995 RepID=A0A840I757_9PROT|nr:EamA family transporter RarD [Parvularcula dongshanensis]MBB4660155.1 chloramphenicol-sensitive protein RarD [Parvularcula dongshanensis]